MYGLNIDPKNPKGNPDPSELRGLGVEMVRFTYHDHRSGAELDPDEKDRQIALLKRYSEAGVGSLVILTYDTYPDKPALDGVWDSYIEAFAQRAGQIAEAMAPWSPAFQVWNEADLAPAGQNEQYTPRLREEVFGQMLRRTYDRIKAVDQKLLVVTGGLASGNPGWLSKVVKLQGGHLPADIVAIHTYGQRPDPDWPHPGWAFGYLGDLIGGYYRAAGKQPLWITEMGVEEKDLGGNRDQVAEFLRRFYKAVAYRFSDKVQQVFWFCYSDGMVPTFGLLDQAHQQKPAYGAFREAVALQPTPRLRREPVRRGLPKPKTTKERLAYLQGQLTDLQGQVHQLSDQQARLQAQLQELLAVR